MNTNTNTPWIELANAIASAGLPADLINCVMYMGIQDGALGFKHPDSRKYCWVKNGVLSNPEVLVPLTIEEEPTPEHEVDYEYQPIEDVPGWYEDACEARIEAGLAITNEWVSEVCAQHANGA